MRNARKRENEEVAFFAKIRKREFTKIRKLLYGGTNCSKTQKMLELRICENTKTRICKNTNVAELRKYEISEHAALRKLRICRNTKTRIYENTKAAELRKCEILENTKCGSCESAEIRTREFTKLRKLLNYENAKCSKT